MIFQRLVSWQRGGLESFGFVGLAFLSGVFFVGTLSATDREIRKFDVKARVSAGSRVTYLDLVGKVFRNARVDGYEDFAADGTVDIRQLSDGSVKKEYAGGLSVAFNSGFRSSDGRTVTVMFWVRAEKETRGDGEILTSDGRRVLRYSTIVVIYIRTTSDPAVLDAVEVEQEGVQTYLKRGNLAGYFWVVNAHYNCTRGLKSYSLVSNRNGRLAEVFSDLPVIYDDEDCGSKLRQEPYLVPGRPVSNGALIMYLNVVSEQTQYYGPCTGRVKSSETKYFQYKLRREADGRMTTLVSGKKALRRELEKLGLEYPEETDPSK